jgi:hypothetical protein
VVRVYRVGTLFRVLRPSQQRYLASKRCLICFERLCVGRVKRSLHLHWGCRKCKSVLCIYIGAISFYSSMGIGIINDVTLQRKVISFILREMGDEADSCFEGSGSRSRLQSVLKRAKKEILPTSHTQTSRKWFYHF